MRLRGAFAGPGRKPWGLAFFTILYLAWSLAPIFLAVRVSFNADWARNQPAGFSLDWYEFAIQDPSLRSALRQSLTLAALTMLIATPIGVGLAIGLTRWRGRGARAAGLLVLVPMATPEIVLAVALFLVVTETLDFIRLGTQAQLLGHVTFALAFVVVIVRGRLLAIGREYEEMAMDLGASQLQAVRAVLLPMLAPAILAALMIVFAISLDDFVISAFLAGEWKSETVPVRLYGGIRAGPSPALNALASFLLVSSLAAITLAGLTVRRFRQRQGLPARSATEDLARFRV